jgi:hypothetical protein
MRMIFGLVGVLVTVGVIILILYFAYLPHAKTAIDAGNRAKAQAGQMGGLDTSTGMRASESIKMEGEQSGGKVQSVLVTDIIAGGPMEKTFGLKRNDSIVEVGPQVVRDINDEDMAKALILEAYQRQWTLIVVRDGERVKLEPGSGTKTAASPAAAPTGATAEQKPAANSGDPLQRQLDTLQRIPTH